MRSRAMRSTWSCCKTRQAGVAPVGSWPRIIEGRCASRRIRAGYAAWKEVGVAQSGVTVEPVRVGFDAAVLGDLGRRLSAARLAPGGGTGWGQGVPRSWLAGVLADWQRFDTAR